MKALFKIGGMLLLITVLQGCCVFHGGGMSDRQSNRRSGLVRVSQFTGPNGTLMWAHHDPTQRQTLMYVDGNGRLKVLAEQSPDAGVSNVADISASADVEGKVDAETAIKIQAQLEKLTNRTTSLMITRETLYAIREASFNGQITPAEAILMYNSFLAKLDIIVVQDAKIEEAKAEGLKAEAEKAKAELEKAKLDSKENDNDEDGAPDNAAVKPTDKPNDNASKAKPKKPAKKAAKSKK